MYWTAKYMHDAASSATSSDPHWGLGGGLTPLAAVFAAKWRQQVGWAIVCQLQFLRGTQMHAAHQ